LRKVDGRSAEVGFMGRRYAAALGLLAFASTLVRGAIAGGAWDSTLSNAILCLCIFSLVGGAAGWIAEGIIEEAIRSRLTSEIANKSDSQGANRATQKRT
jgi:hypothetical protein